MILLCHPREDRCRGKGRLCIKAKVVTSLGRNPPRHLMRGSQECDHQTLSTSASINMAQFLFSAFRVNSLGFWLWYCAGIGNRPRKYLPMASVLPHHGALQVASLASSLNFYLYPNMYSFKKSKINVFYELKWYPGSKVSDRFNWLRNHNQLVVRVYKGSGDTPGTLIRGRVIHRSLKYASGDTLKSQVCIR